MYSLPTFRFTYVTLSMIVDSLAGAPSLRFVALSVAWVLISIMSTVCASSLISLCSATTVSGISEGYNSSNATTVCPARPFVFAWNFRSTNPSAFSGVNVAVAVTILPSVSMNGSLVALSIRVPFMVYSLPGIRPVYDTWSFHSAVSRASPSSEFVITSLRCVPISIIHSLCFSSLMSVCSATGTSYVSSPSSRRMRVSNATATCPARFEESSVNTSSLYPALPSSCDVIVKTSSCVTLLPSALSSSLLVVLSIRTPESLYLPGSRFL